GAPVRCPSPCSCLAGRERPELLSRLAPLNPPASGARDVPARSTSECNRRLGEGSGTPRLSEPLRPGTGRAPKEGSWAGRSTRRQFKNSRHLFLSAFTRCWLTSIFQLNFGRVASSTLARPV